MRFGRGFIRFLLVIAIIISAFIGVFVSNDLRTAYEKIEPVDSDIGNTVGLMASEDASIPVITTLDELVESRGDRVVLEVDADKIEATGIVQDKDSIYPIFPANTDVFRKISFIYDNKITARNYVVTLDDDNKIAVSLCDLAYEVPSEGRVRLPIGVLAKYKSSRNEDTYVEMGMSKENTVYELDCYSSLGVLDEIQAAKSAATTRSVIIIVVTVIVASILLIVLQIGSKNKKAK